MNTGELRLVGVDYFTITCQLSNAEQVWKQAKRIAQDLDGALKQRQWRFFGYQGFVYSAGSSGHFAYGDSGSELQGAIVQASGEMAQRYVTTFFMDVARWSRIDLTVDCELKTPEPTLCLGYYDWIIANTGKSRRYSLIQSNLGGQTLYVGSRASEEFGRVYDKGAESGGGFPLGALWRYEVELKGDAAKSAASSLMSHTLRQSSTTHAIAVTVFDWFDRRNVPPRFSRRLSDGLDLKAVATNRGSDRLVWLRKQVSPTVRDMLASGDRRVLDALGVTEYYNLERK